MIEDEYVRPDPEELLKRISAEETNEKKGRLTIFFGYAPGVGKTYAMLYDAILRKTEQKLDVVVGYIELHRRKETEELAKNFETIQPLTTNYNDLALKEPNVTEILLRKPNLVLIDELAHTNATKSKNDKRYKDVEEILDAGINVYTTLNVQHLESLKDIIHQITGVKVAENIPDPIFLYANEVKLIDLPIDDLLKRLKDGKVYTKDMAGKAVQKFFRSGNLLALRQIALKQVALRIDKQMVRYIKAHDLKGSWPAPEKVLIGINASSYAGQLVRAAYRLSMELEAEIIALHIETDEDKKFSEDERKWLKNALDVAERLGIQTITVQSNDFSSKISSFAEQNGITKIIIGKPYSSGSYRSVDSILAKTEGVDMYIFAGRGNISLKTQTSSIRNPVKEMFDRIRRVNKRATITKNVQVRTIPNRYLILHNRKACIGCGQCASMYPENWIISEDGKATPKMTEIDEIGANKDVAEACPAGCIKIVPKKETDIF